MVCYRGLCTVLSIWCVWFKVDFGVICVCGILCAFLFFLFVSLFSLLLCMTGRGAGLWNICTKTSEIN